MLLDAIQTYHDLLTPSVAAASQEHLDRLTARHQLHFGERPVCSVLRPRFLTSGQFQFLQSVVHRLAGAFQKAYDAAMADSEFRRQFLLTPVEEELLKIDSGFSCPGPTARLDSFFVPEQRISDNETVRADLKFTEFNTETPAGAGYNDALSELFLGMPVVQAFTRKYQLRPLPARPGVQHAILDAFHQWAGNRSEPPRIAILDWAEVPTFSEFRIFQRWFGDQGLECRIVDPRKVEYLGGKLRAGDFTFNLIYKRVLIAELLDRGGIEHPVVRAVRDGAVCMVNTFRCKILFKKASFAVLSDERHARLFSATEREAISAHIPWTRVVAERKTQYQGEEIDLIPHVLKHREEFVLKPNDDYGGHGIVLGWTVDAAVWEKAMREAMASPYVVQERVNLPHEIYPNVIDGRVQFIERMLDTNPFVCFNSTMDGCLTRISTEALLNVTAGGGSTVPTFVVEER